MDSDVILGRLIWFQLIGELRQRGRNRRESGAFLLARPGSRRISQIAYYDDLDPHCLQGGYIRFDSSGYVRLSQLCQRKRLRVIADVHTHPGSWTDQSTDDRTHPMMARAGHVGLIIPRFAQSNRFDLHGVRAFAYLGDGNWQNCNQHLHLTWI